MMGVYINMEMPTDCGKCRFAVDGWCYAYGKPNIDALANDGRTNFCPLVPVPPHGRLIDADRLANSINRQNAILHALGPDIAEIGDILAKGFLQELANAPTIIPAEEGE